VRGTVRSMAQADAQKPGRPAAETLAKAFDLALVVVVAVLTELDVWVFETIHGARWATSFLPLLLALPLWWRRKRPLLSAMLVLAGVLIHAVATEDSIEGLELIIGLGAAAYSVAAYASRRQAYAALAAFTVGYGVYALEDRNIRTGRTGELWAGAFFAVALLACWLIGIFVRSGRERAALQALAAEHERAAAAAVADERARLARELHDIVSHNLSVVVLQAGGARAQGAHAPEGALEKIERSSREALVEMRRLLGVLRESGETSELSPQPGIDQLEGLAATVRATGLDVELRAEGDHAGLSPALEMSVYRIVQEALTNTIKHAHATRVEVSVNRTPESVIVEIVDDGTAGPRDPSGGTGHGLVGMRERVALFGGELHAGPRPGGGFRVHARLPIADAS
jgi:signal transduction histidine kinase